MILNKKIESKKKRKHRGILFGYEPNSGGVISDENIHVTLDELTRKIPEITFDLTKNNNGTNSADYELFNHILVLLGDLLRIFNSTIIFTNESNYFETFNKMAKLFEGIVIWLSVNDSKILTTIIYSIPLLIDILVNLKRQCINIRVKKRQYVEHSELNTIIQKSMKKAIQIFSCLSVSTETRVRVACVYCTTLIAKLEEFDMSIIEDALSTPISPINYLDSKTNNCLLIQGDTTNPELFVASIPKFHEANSRQSFTHLFSIINYERIINNCGSNNDLFDKGWLSRRLDDESPAVRFEIFILIYELIENIKIKNSKALLNSINEIVYDCFLDENIAIQSLVSEIITNLSETSPISINNINKILPIINDSNIYTRYNILKVISNSYFEDVEALHKALTAVLESPLLHFDEKLVFNVFSSAAIKNSTFAHEIIPILFEQYYIKEEEIYHASISIFLFWAIWKTPSIVKNINFDLLLLYPAAKFNFSSNIPDLRIRVSNENAGSYNFEVKPQLYNSNILNYSLGLYPMKLKNKFINTNLFKKGLFVSIGNIQINEFLKSTTMEMCLSEHSPIESIFKFSISKFTSITYITMNRKSFFNLLEVLTSYLKIKKINPRTNVMFNISSVQFLMGSKFFTQSNLIKCHINFGASPKEFRTVNLPISYSIWPVNSKFSSELCKIFDNNVLICSSFIISSPDICGSISSSYFFENYMPKKNKYEKLCLLLGNLTDKLIEFRSLFCQCIICKFNTYYQESHPEYLDGSSKVVFSKIKDIILKRTKTKFYTFPFKVLQKIPVCISFDVHSSINKEKTSIDQSVHLFIQTPQALGFKNSDLNQLGDNDNRKSLICGPHTILNEVNSINFESYNTANVYCQINKSTSFIATHSKKDDPIKNDTIPLMVDSRQAYVFPIAKDTLRISMTDLIQIKFDYPIASPVTMNAAVVNKKSCLVSTISNLFPMNIHPNIMA
ncbi:hypothetical protein [Cryptosporidium parvum Iowa II]|uniref:Uncharacterized protein n=3 Tax=Cryptosporidium parvum TaxID=5807 RepID=Q5CXA9_CRYPI|nr:hypothetical protein [Cryptosporidium parvum Iowa II]EAK89848.1 hypothetical protein cgd6_1790 [Cryptosporidium parvum Iowa II]QOY41059.1 Uncharacterized protein with Armadillo-like helical [Cryptosporidium parvum]WKS78288.1 hypothetical protein CPCDC_6g1790 [Cryptosporidium sp. 43IA8]WRK32778.1 Armadillo-like helical protein [Cryptosporidium parvum]|eukprot:QOY41059.1 hypothetical protein CPATCC_002701 [Cryptosporidium parvum]